MIEPQGQASYLDEPRQRLEGRIGAIANVRYFGWVSVMTGLKLGDRLDVLLLLFAQAICGLIGYEFQFV